MRKNNIDIETAVIPDDKIILQCDKDEKQYKCIPDAKLARELLKLGNIIVDIKPLKKEDIDKNKKPSNFVFKITEKLKEDYKDVTGFELRL